MKKSMLIILLTLLLFCTACSSQQTGGKVPAITPTTEPTIEPTKDPYEGWTRVAGYVLYMPNWPYEEWDTMNQDNIGCYEVFIQSNDSTKFHEYVQSLVDYGFSIEQTESYSYKAIDPQGKTLYLTDHENGQIEISYYYR